MSYTYSGTYGNGLSSNGYTIATLSWSWNNTAMDGTPSNVANMLITPLTNSIGVVAPTEYTIATNGLAGSSAPVTSYTNAPLPSFQQKGYGEWIQIQVANPVLVVSIGLVAYDSEQMINSFIVVGSNDGINWNYMTSNTNMIIWNVGVPSIFTTTTMQSYTYYRFIMTQAPSPFNLSGIILYTTTGPVLGASSLFTISGNTLKVNNIVIATISNSQSTQNMAAIMPSDGYKYSYLTMNNINRSSNNMSTTSAPLTTYTYIVPS
jgi:hypothetical protein